MLKLIKCQGLRNEKGEVLGLRSFIIYIWKAKHQPRRNKIAVRIIEESKSLDEVKKGDLDKAFKNLNDALKKFGR